MQAVPGMEHFTAEKLCAIMARLRLRHRPSPPAAAVPLRPPARRVALRALLNCWCTCGCGRGPQKGTLRGSSERKGLVSANPALHVVGRQPRLARALVACLECAMMSHVSRKLTASMKSKHTAQDAAIATSCAAARARGVTMADLAGTSPRAASASATTQRARERPRAPSAWHHCEQSPT